MSCTCFQRKYPCDVHKDNHLPEVDEYELRVIVVRVHAKWVGDGLKYFSTIAKDAVRTYTSSLTDTEQEATELAANRLRTNEKDTKK